MANTRSGPRDPEARHDEATGTITTVMRLGMGRRRGEDVRDADQRHQRAARPTWMVHPQHDETIARREWAMPTTTVTMPIAKKLPRTGQRGAVSADAHRGREDGMMTRAR
jgi:hypothetical protein